jgi:hypothetical protein
LKRVDSSYTTEFLSIFHRRLDAIFVWYNLYYELTISIKKLSGLLRCDDCDDWPRSRFRSLTTERERRAKRAEDEPDYDISSDESDMDIDEETKDENKLEFNESQSINSEEENDADILPKVCRVSTDECSRTNN